MVKDYLSIAADAYGVPTTTTTTAVAFTARAVVTDFVDTTAPTEASGGDLPEVPREQGDPGREVLALDGTEDANQDNTNDAGVNDTNRHNQAQVCTTCHLHKDQFEASCTNCHGTVGVNYYPDSGANGIVAPNRAGKHAAHIARIVRAERALRRRTTEHVRLVPPGWGALGGRGGCDAGALGAAHGGGDGFSDDQRAQRRGWGGERGELHERELPLQHDGDDRGLVQRAAGADLHVLSPDGRGVQRGGESAAERAHEARGRGGGRRVQLRVHGLPPEQRRGHWRTRTGW